MRYEKWQEMMRLHKHLINVLNQASRRNPREFDLEVRAVHSAAVLWAKDHEGCVPPDLDDVIMADNYQAGHSDWGSKFPLYVAELTYGLNPWEPVG